MKIFVPAAAVVFVFRLWRQKKITGPVFAAGVAGLLICLVLTVGDVRIGERREIQRLDKNSRENAREVIELEARTGDGRLHEVKLRIPEETANEAEIGRILKKAADGMEKTILGKNRSADHVEWNLELPATVCDGQVNCAWSSDHPAMLSWDGKIQTNVPEGGQTVMLRACLEMQGENRIWEKKIRLYPSREETAFQKKAQEQSERLSRNRRQWLLPERMDGEKVTWYQKRGGKGEILSLLILLLVAGSVRVRERRKEEAEKAFREKKMRQYPEIVSQLQLFTAAGLGLRQAMKRLARVDPEAARCCYEMENGVPEQDAYTRFGERCKTAEYRKLALLLAQSQTKGGARLSELLEEETQEAFENRKRRAKVLGEKAAVRMVLPMALMLVIVLVIIMVPAMLAFD
jgi:hypothetical protein